MPNLNLFGKTPLFAARLADSASKPQPDMRSTGDILIEPAPQEQLFAPPTQSHSPDISPKFLLQHANDARFDPNIYTPENLIQRGILRGLDPRKTT